MRSILRPIVRFALRGGCNFRTLSRLLKAEFAHVGAEELSRSGVEVTASRVAVFTGLNRNDVTALRHGLGRPSEPSASIAARVLSTWERDKRFCNSRMKPRAITCVGKGCEFDQLVQSVSAHLGFHTVLNELERLGLVERTKAVVRPTANAAWASRDVVRGLDFLGRNIAIATSAIAENAQSGQPLNPHLTTTYDNVYVSALPIVRKFLHTESLRFHKRLRQILSSYDADTTSNPKNEEAGVKVSLFSVGFTETTANLGSPPERATGRSA